MVVKSQLFPPHRAAHREGPEPHLLAGSPVDLLDERAELREVMSRPEERPAAEVVRCTEHVHAALVTDGAKFVEDGQSLAAIRLANDAGEVEVALEGCDRLEVVAQILGGHIQSWRV